MAVYGRQISDLPTADMFEIINDASPGEFAVDAADAIHKYHTGKIDFYTLSQLFASYGSIRDALSRVPLGPKGYYSFEDPSIGGTMRVGEYWWPAASATAVQMPITGFPVIIKTWYMDVTQDPAIGRWIDGTAYNPGMWDQWANLLDNGAYYWFLDKWLKLDLTVDGVTLTSTDGIISIANQGVTRGKLADAVGTLIDAAVQRTGDSMTGALVVQTPTLDTHPAQWGQVKNLMPQSATTTDLDIAAPGTGYAVNDIVQCEDGIHFVQVTAVNNSGPITGVVATLDPVTVTAGTGAVITSAPQTFTCAIDSPGHYYELNEILPVIVDGALSPTATAQITLIASDDGIAGCVVDGTAINTNGSGANIHIAETYTFSIINGGQLYEVGDTVPTDLPNIMAVVQTIDTNGAITFVTGIRGTPNFHGNGANIIAYINDVAITIIDGGIGYAVDDIVPTDALGLFVRVITLATYGSIGAAVQSNLPRTSTKGVGGQISAIITSYTYTITKAGNGYIIGDVLQSTGSGGNVSVLTIRGAGGILGITTTTAIVPTGTGAGAVLSWSLGWKGGNLDAWNKLGMINVDGLLPQMRQVINQVGDLNDTVREFEDENGDKFATKLPVQNDYPWNIQSPIPAQTVMINQMRDLPDAELVTKNAVGFYTARPFDNGYYLGWFKTEPDMLNFGVFQLIGQTISPIDRIIIWNTDGVVMQTRRAFVFSTILISTNAWSKSSVVGFEVPNSMIIGGVMIPGHQRLDLVDVREELIDLITWDMSPKIPLTYIQQYFATTIALGASSASDRTYTDERIAEALAGDVIGYFGYGRTDSTTSMPTAIGVQADLFDFEDNHWFQYSPLTQLWQDMGVFSNLQTNSEIRIIQMLDGQDQLGHLMAGLSATALWTGTPLAWEFASNRSFAPDGVTTELVSGSTFGVKAQTYNITDDVTRFTSGATLVFTTFWQNVLNKINGILGWKNTVFPASTNGALEVAYGGTGNANGVAQKIVGAFYEEATTTFQAVINTLPNNSFHTFLFRALNANSTMPVVGHLYSCTIVKNTTGGTICTAADKDTGIFYVMDATDQLVGHIWLGGQYTSTIYDQAENGTLFAPGSNNEFYFIQQIRNNLKYLMNQATAANSAVAAMQIIVDTLNQTTIPTLQQEMLDLTAEVTAVNGAITTAQGNITTLQGQMTTAQGNITGLVQDIQDINVYLGNHLPGTVPVAPGRYVLEVGAGNTLAWVAE